jgi:hypothetical protein
MMLALPLIIIAPMEPVEGESTEDTMIVLQLAIVNKLIKRYFPDKVVTNEFKKEFTKSLSLFILYLQNSIDKKKYGRDDLIAALEREGFARVAQDLRNNKESTVVAANTPKRVTEVEP